MRINLRQTCSIEISKGFGFLNVPEHVYNELIKLKGTVIQII